MAEVWDGGKKLTEYIYNPDGFLRKESHGPLTKEYSYDGDKNIAGMRILCGNDLLADNQYHYDGNGNLLEKRQLSGITTYVYDALNQLVRAEYPSYGEELFYDKAGNRTRRLTAGMEDRYHYDAGNRLTKLTRNGEDIFFQYDNAGNVLSDGRTNYSYDAFNRMTRVEAFDGNIQINRYDAEGFRAGMEENGYLIQSIYNTCREISRRRQCIFENNNVCGTNA